MLRRSLAGPRSRSARLHDPVATRTKEAICEKARVLFNERGIGPVSTNHIAAAMGISPGNLYYHYRNKGEIVRAIFSTMVVDTDATWANASFRVPADLRAVLDAHCRALGPYAFLSRELAAVAIGDAAFSDAVDALRAKRDEQVRRAFMSLTRSGAMRPIAPRTSTALVDVVVTWLLLWPAHARILGREVDRGGEAVLREVLAPYLLEPLTS